VAEDDGRAGIMPPLGGSFDIDTFCKAGLLSAAFTPCIPAVVTVPASSLLKLRLSMALLLSLSHHMNAKKGLPLLERQPFMGRAFTG
jgi:hypothetical protein